MILNDSKRLTVDFICTFQKKVFYKAIQLAI